MAGSTRSGPPKTFLEYVGCQITAEGREYRLRSHVGATSREFTVGIGRDCFTSGRARFQDGPEISYDKLRRELSSTDDGPAETHFTISEEELAAFRAARTPAPRGRAKPVVAR